MIIVNDAIRRPPSTQLVQALAQDVRERIVGVSPLAIGTDPTEPQGPFATNAYDCVNLIALAAVQAGSDDPERDGGRDGAGEHRRRQLPASSPTASSCSTTTATSTTTGPGGAVEIGTDGDPVRARFDLFEFDENGVDVSRPSGLTIPRSRRQRPMPSSTSSTDAT